MKDLSEEELLKIARKITFDAVNQIGHEIENKSQLDRIAHHIVTSLLSGIYCTIKQEGDFEEADRWLATVMSTLSEFLSQHSATLGQKSEFTIRVLRKEKP